MKQEEPSRLVVMIADQLHKEAKASAALQGVTLRVLVEKALEAYLGGERSKVDKVDRPAEAPKDASPEMENAFAQLLEKEVDRANAEHARRVASGVIKG